MFLTYNEQFYRYNVSLKGHVSSRRSLGDVLNILPIRASSNTGMKQLHEINNQTTERAPGDIGLSHNVMDTRYIAGGGKVRVRVRIGAGAGAGGNPYTLQRNMIDMARHP